MTYRSYDQDCNHIFHFPMNSSPAGNAGKVRAHTQSRQRSESGLCARTKRPQYCEPVHHPTAKESRVE